MKLDDLAKQLANRVNQEHYIKWTLDKVAETAYDKGFKDAQEQVKKLNIDDVSGSDLIAKAEQYLEEAKYKIENFNEYDDDFGRGSYFGVKRIVNLIKRHYR